MAEELQAELQSAQPTTLSDSVHRIPGIGIVRARALEKAGYSTLAQVKTLKVDDLTAIRGISDIKAQQILDFVAGLKTASRRTRRPAPPREPAPAPPQAPEPPVVLEGLVREAAKEISRVSAELLRSPNSAQFNNKLARQLGKLAFYSDRLGAAGLPAGANGERFASRLNKLKDLLATLAADPHTGTAKQTKLSIRLRSIRKELQNLT